MQTYDVPVEMIDAETPQDAVLKALDRIRDAARRGAPVVFEVMHLDEDGNREVEDVSMVLAQPIEDPR